MLDPKNLSNGQEQHEQYHSALAGGKRIQYDYRHTNGKLFTVVRKTLAECRTLRDAWLLKQEQPVK